MSGTYYCHECEERRSVILTPIATCAMCGCNYIEEIPTVLEDDTTDEEDFNRELDFFCNYPSIRRRTTTTTNNFQVIHEGEEDDDDDEELLEERCLYEQLSSIYNHPIARTLSTSPLLSSTLNHSNSSSSSDLIALQQENRRIHDLLSSITNDNHITTEEEEEEDIVAYDILFEQRGVPSRSIWDTNNDHQQQEETATTDTGSTSIFQLPFARIGRLLDNMYSYRSDEESEEGDGTDNYHRRSFLDNLADILSDYTQDIETTPIPSVSSPCIDVILSSLKKKYLESNDPDVEDECIICQDAFGTTLEIFHLPCHHKFHGTCISRWLNIKTSCPVCRQPAHREIKEQEQQDISATGSDHINTQDYSTSFMDHLFTHEEELDFDYHDRSPPTIVPNTDNISSEDDVYYQLSILDSPNTNDQDLIQSRNRLARLRQELAVHRNHWVSSSPSNYQLGNTSSSINRHSYGDIYDHIMGSHGNNNSFGNEDMMDWTLNTASSMEEVD